ncbi:MULTISPECIES: hypothetical protein [Halomonas]|uniref:Uncharacterized protein n=1 Tax=Halomonas ventosae TaxID=229007 RepID=A0A4R6I598_9GAMM|nr:hypothetical protein [Halomonas ventosae]TDO16634.1 hypothetical protein DFO68_101162 [Halomonas ventosae]
MGFKRRTSFNPKRRLQAPSEEVPEQWLHAGYGGNPEHKRNPGDFGLTPPANPRPHKSLCDDASITSREQAKALLLAGIKKGLVSQQRDHAKESWPQNIWAVTADGIALEARLENAERGTYHGYPMPEQDPLADRVREEWRKRDE